MNILRGMAPQRLRGGVGLPRHVQRAAEEGRGVFSLQPERPEMADRAAMALEAHRPQEETGAEPGLDGEEEAGATWLSETERGGEASLDPGGVSR